MLSSDRRCLDENVTKEMISEYHFIADSHECENWIRFYLNQKRNFFLFQKPKIAKQTEIKIQ